MMNAYRGSVIESSPQRTVRDKMGSRFVKNVNSEQNHLSKTFSFYADNLFSCAHLETCDKCPFLSGLLPFFFYSVPVLGKKCNTFCSFKAEMSRVG